MVRSGGRKWVGGRRLLTAMLSVAAAEMQYL